MLLAIISDIHSDYPSLEKAMERIGTMYCDRIICLGDIVGYSYHYSGVLDGRDPDACCRMVKKHCQTVICGNHDLHALGKLPSNHLKLGLPGNWYTLDLGERAELSEGRFWLYEDELPHALSAASRQYLSSLPETHILGTEEFGILCTHFIAPDLMGLSQAYPASHKDFRAHFKLLRKEKCLLGICGHAHLEGYIQVSKRYYRMNYFGRGKLVSELQVLLVPAITRGGARNGFIILDTESREFEAVPLD